MGGFIGFADQIAPEREGVFLESAGEVLEIEGSGFVLGGLEQELDELGDGGLDQGGIEGGIEIGFGKLNVQIKRDRGEELEGSASEDLGEVEVDVGADEFEGA